MSSILSLALDMKAVNVAGSPDKLGSAGGGLLFISASMVGVLMAGVMI